MKEECSFPNTSVVCVTVRQTNELVGLFLFDQTSEGHKDMNASSSSRVTFFHCIDPVTLENFAFNNTKFNVELAFEKLKNMKHRIEDVQKAVNLLAH